MRMRQLNSLRMEGLGNKMASMLMNFFFNDPAKTHLFGQIDCKFLLDN